MSFSLRSAFVVLAAMSASSVAPAKVAPEVPPVVSAGAAISPGAITQQLLQDSDQVVAPLETAPQAVEQPDAQSVEAVDADLDLPTLVAQLRSSDPGSRELECLAAGVYFESKSEPLAGQLAVGQVIANRAESGRFADTYCGVLFQRGQFSFVHGKSWPHISKQGKQWKTAVAIAKIVDGNLKESAVEDALFFHARRVHPGWHLKRVASIGNHVFFR